jgi:uncharacterized protein DUF6221
MTDIRAFLGAAFDDDERIIRAAMAAFWYMDGHDRPVYEHLERFGADRLLAEIAAKRRILELHRAHPSPKVWRQEICGVCAPLDPWPCTTVRLLAAPLRDMPGWLPEWEVTE